MEVSVRSNIKQFIQQMNNAEKKQVPYATSLALNAVAVKAQENIQKSIEGKFNNRKKWWLRQQPTGVKVKFTDRRKDNLKKSSVFLGPKNWWGDLQGKGGTKKGKRGNIAIPKKENVLDKFEKAGSAYKLVNDGQYFKRNKDGKEAIFRRLKNGKLKYMYALSSSVKIKPRLNFEQTVRKTVQRHFEKIFWEKFKYAWDTRKK